MRVVPFLLVGLTLPPACLCQQTLYDETRILYKKEAYGGFTAHGDGWGVNFTMAHHRTARMRWTWGVELVGMKHPKEVKSFNPYYEDSRGYFFGKLNSLLLLRPTYGRKVQITDKLRKSGVEVNYVWGIGPSIGLLKPVYLQIGYDELGAMGNYPFSTITIERYDPYVHTVDAIFGRASWFKGVNEMGLAPGVFGRFGFNFEYAGPATGIKALEVGVSVDAFAQPVPIMAELEGVENKQFFLEFYLQLLFGKKLIR